MYMKVIYLQASGKRWHFIIQNRTIAEEAAHENDIVFNFENCNRETLQ